MQPDNKQLRIRVGALDICRGPDLSHPTRWTSYNWQRRGTRPRSPLKPNDRLIENDPIYVLFDRIRNYNLGNTNRNVETKTRDDARDYMQ